MEDLKKPSVSGAPAEAVLADALTLWKAEAGAAAAALAEIRIDQNERLVVPFTTSVVRVTVHYLDYPSFRGFVRCNGRSCLLCRIGRKADTRDLWPVYDVIGQAVGVLPVPANLRPQALKPQLAPILTRLAGDERVLLALRKLDNYRFSVATLALPEEADDGADKIAAFQEQLEAGAIDLAGVYPGLTNEELVAFPEVATAVKVRGIQL